MSIDTEIKIFKWVSIAEAISFLVLLLIAMPLKYIFHQPEMVRIVGMVHGVLFVLYVMGTFYMYQALNWSFKTLAIAIVCSALPLGPIYVDRKFLPTKA